MGGGPRTSTETLDIRNSCIRVKNDARDLLARSTNLLDKGQRAAVSSSAALVSKVGFVRCMYFSRWPGFCISNSLRFVVRTLKTFTIIVNLSGPLGLKFRSLFRLLHGFRIQSDIIMSRVATGSCSAVSPPSVANICLCIRCMLLQLHLQIRPKTLLFRTCLQMQINLQRPNQSFTYFRTI